MRLSLISVGPPYRGGISDLSALIFHELDGQHTVQFINYARQYPKLLFPGKTEYKLGAQAADLPSKRLIDSINPLSWYRAAQEIISFGPEVVLFRYWNPFFACLIAYMSRRLRRTGIRVAILVDNLIPHERSFIDKFMARLVLTHTDHIFTMSRSVSRDVSDLKPEVRMTTLFHPLYEIYQARYSKEEAREKLGLEDRPIALFFGLIRPYKGLDILIKALGQLKDQLPDLRTYILGEAYEDEQQYRDLIQEQGLGSQTIFRNEFIADDELPLYFAACDVLILPYRTATQSGIIGIAFQMDRPVIATQVGGLGEYVQEGVTGYLTTPEDPKALSETILKFYRGDDRERMVRNVREYKRQFSIQHFCDQLMGGLAIE